MSKHIIIKQPREKFTTNINFTTALSTDETLVTGSFVNAHLLNTNTEFTGLVNTYFYGDKHLFVTIESGSAGSDYKLSFVALTNTGSVWEDDIIVQVRDI